MISNNFKLKRLGETRVRLAPSPTGFFHIGTARTALFNYLFAKKQQGRFILRIEDTDIERSDKKFEKDILDNLKWLGLQWDEGPYRQSERLDIYKKYLEKLLKEGKAYHCFCSKEELEAQRQYQMSIGQPPRYNGKCRDLGEDQVKQNLEKRSRSVIRFKVPGKIVKFDDIIRGGVEFDAKLLGDISIAKYSDGVFNPLYNFAVVVDDFEMEISHVIRGEDHLSNTPKQILIQEALEFAQPKYAHVPLILGPDRSKLSKRHGAVAVNGYKKLGYLAESLVNFMALLGWNSGTEREVFSLNSLIKEFSLKQVQKGGAIFNLKKLDWFNSFYIRQKPIEKLTELCLDYLPQAVDFNKAKKIVAAYSGRLKNLSEIDQLTKFLFKEIDYSKELLKWKDMPNKELKKAIDRLLKVLSKIKLEDFDKENLEKVLMPEAEKFSKVGDRGCLLWPLRVALTGKKASAGPFEVADILGKEETLKRLKQAKKCLGK